MENMEVQDNREVAKTANENENTNTEFSKLLKSTSALWFYLEPIMTTPNNGTYPLHVHHPNWRLLYISLEKCGVQSTKGYINEHLVHTR